MQSLSRLVAIGGAVAVLCFAVAARAEEKAKSQDPTQVASDTYRVLLDNDAVRVLEVDLKAAAKIPMHSHPGYVIYALTPGKVRFGLPDGKTADVEFQAGQTLWRDAESHAVENLGDSACRVLNIELKGVQKAQGGAQMAGLREPGEHAEHRMIAAGELKWQAGPVGLPSGAQFAILSGDPGKPGPFTLRAKMPAGYKIAAHYHPADEHVTVISGGLFMGMGDKLDESKGKEIAPGGFALMPAGQHHFAWTTQETTIQLHGIGPWGITYINPADDPRKTGEGGKLDSSPQPADGH